MNESLWSPIMLGLIALSVVCLIVGIRMKRPLSPPAGRQKMDLVRNGFRPVFDPSHSTSRPPALNHPPAPVQQTRGPAQSSPISLIGRPTPPAVDWVTGRRLGN